jgi:curved DNA-binding protein CbpA
MKERSAYKVLGVERDASFEAIRAAYRSLARTTHPDRAGNDPQAHERFIEVRTAYELLGDPTRRSLYDRDPEGLFETELEEVKRRAQIARRRKRLRRLYE